MMNIQLIILVLLISLTSCQQENETRNASKNITECEYIIRNDTDTHLAISIPKTMPPPQYPWQSHDVNTISVITKDYFCCKGSSVNPPRIVLDNGKEVNRFYDCGGVEKHSLPIRDGKEFIYPILIEILNWIQEKTHKPVIITSGHRCPSHNAWVDPSFINTTSKHCIGAEVDFYVSGLEHQPDIIVSIIQEFYQKNPRYLSRKEYTNFSKFEKPTNTKAKPLYNKEIFIKKFLASEGRNLDNRHPYPYLSIQVRYDKERNAPVMYTWDLAQNFLRK